VRFGTAFQLPNGHFITNPNGLPLYTNTTQLVMTSFGTANASKTSSMQHLDDTLIWAISFLRAPAGSEWPDEKPEAVECALYYCLNEFRTTVNSSVVEEATTPVPDWRRSPDSWQCAWVNELVVELSEFIANGTFQANDSEVVEMMSWLVSMQEDKTIAFDPTMPFLFDDRSDLALISSEPDGPSYNLSPSAVDSISAHFQENFKFTLNNSLAIFWYPANESDIENYFPANFTNYQGGLPLANASVYVNGPGSVNASSVNWTDVPQTGNLTGWVMHYGNADVQLGSPTVPDTMQAFNLLTPDITQRFAALARSMTNALRDGDAHVTAVAGDTLALQAYDRTGAVPMAELERRAAEREALFVSEEGAEEGKGGERASLSNERTRLKDAGVSA
jgi:hypothetical protein